ncbi:MAG: alpha/beta hydrolase-fold protein [Nitrospiria bacterium]
MNIKRMISVSFFLSMWLFSLPNAFSMSLLVNTEKTLEENTLNLLVQQFLISTDKDQSASFLAEILKHKEASIENLEILIKTGRLYPPEPFVGSLHRDINIDGNALSYALYVPKSYNPSISYPLIVCLHGAGFVGDTYLERWEKRLEEGAILVCPTIGGGAWWSPLGEALVLETIAEVESKYHVDPNRIILTGMSNGGIGAYLVGIFHADRFAAISPMASGIPDEIFAFLKNFSMTGIYIIHGEKDQVMPVSLSRKVSKYLKKERISHVYREHDREHRMAGGHFFPREELPALIKWLKVQRKMVDPAHIISVRDKSHASPFFWTEINKTMGEIADVQKSLFDQDEIDLVKAGAFAILTAEVNENHISVMSERVKRYTLFLNNRLIDFSQPLIISTNGKKSFEGRLSESRTFLLEESKRRQDRSAFYSASVTIDLQ